VSERKIENSRAHNKTTEHFAEAIAALRDGDVIVFPTETLYGLGADALNCRAVEQVFQLKGRDPLNPIPVLVADQRMLYHLVTDLPTLAQKLIDQFWPGPLTLVLPGRKDIPTSLLNATGEVGVRLSSEPIATQLVRALGRPLTATSANPSGQEPARTLQEANKYFADRIQIFVDGGTLTSKRGSTVVEVMADRIKIIREGEIRAVELRRFFGSGKILTT
jgi:L-threonylcarbamoyladenylate synthase